MITREHTQEALSTAYVHALAGMAGLNIATRPLFDYGIDGTFHRIKVRHGERVPMGPPVNFQVKATTDWSVRGSDIVYDLEARAHRFIADPDPAMPMAVLILLCLPGEAPTWMESTEDQLLLRNCCYWYTTDDPPTTNVSSKRILIPRQNLLTPTSLSNLMLVARQKALGQ